MLESSSKHFLGSLVLAFLCCLMVETSPHDSSIDAGAHIAELKHLAHCMAVRLLCLHRQHEKREKEQQQQEEGTHQGSFPPRCVFSDLDGTLLHFGGNLLKESYEILPFDGAEKEALSIFKDIGRREMAGGQPSTQHEEECAAVSLGPLWGPAPPSQATCLHSSSELSADSQVPSPPASSSPPAPPCVGRTGSSAPAPRYVTLRYQPDGTTRTCIELPSLSSGPGYISVRTLELVQAIRREGCLFVLLTGARSSTYLMRRRTGLPVVDYECIEGGGRLIHDPNARLDLASDAHSEGHEGWDRTWKEAVGPLQGLWGLYEELKGEGWGVDGRDYYTSFRVDTRGKMGEQWEGVKSRLPALGLSSSFNLGKADIYPRTSGKATALSRLLPRLFLHPSQCVVLFDDDNDLGMADVCASGRRIAVSITHPSVQAYVNADPRVETVTRPGILGSEEALERVLASLV